MIRINQSWKYGWNSSSISTTADKIFEHWNLNASAQKKSKTKGEKLQTGFIKRNSTCQSPTHSTLALRKKNVGPFVSWTQLILNVKQSTLTQQEKKIYQIFSKSQDIEFFENNSFSLTLLKNNMKSKWPYYTVIQISANLTHWLWMKWWLYRRIIFSAKWNCSPGQNQISMSSI